MSGGTTSLTIIVGNLGADPELKVMPGGDHALNISVATSVAWKDKQSGEKREETEWHRCVLFRSQAENAAKYLKKGSKVSITGRNRTRKYLDKESNDRYTTEIMVRDIQYLDRAPSSEDDNKPFDDPTNTGQPAPPPQNFDNFDDDIPF